MKRFVLAGLLAWCGSALALEGNAPTCLDNNGQTLAINNQQVITWKSSTKNEYHSRGHVSGTITKIYPVETGHYHFQLTMENSSDTVEIVYEESFGKINNLAVGQSAEACGDYITSNAPYESYPVSPDGALVHWVHKTDTPKHPAGFVIVNNVVYGQD